MCCLFGILDYGHTLSQRQRERMLSVLAAACEARGTDATGIAYNDARALRIYKRPLPGHRMRFHLPSEARFLMGHTRMATQGSAHRNRNNHPFPGRAGGLSFALAHNGVLHNDRALRRRWKLPESSIETDSYVAVQLLERQGGVSFTNLRFMAEQVEGSFTFTVLDRSDTLSIVKGDNPFCLYHYPRKGLYLYASTEAILQQALRRMPGNFGPRQAVSVACGEILKIAADGMLTRSEFDDANLWRPAALWGYSCAAWERGTHMEALQSVARALGHAPEKLEELAQAGFTEEELEEWLYGGLLE